MLRGQANNAKRGRGMRPGIALPRGGKKAATTRNKASRLGVNFSPPASHEQSAEGAGGPVFPEDAGARGDKRF